MNLNKLTFIKPAKTYDKDFLGCIYYKKAFAITDISKATLICSALGLGKFYINGTEVTQDKLCAPISVYHKTIWCNCYDVTNLLKVGENVISAVASNGFYNEGITTSWNVSTEPFRDYPKIVCSLTMDNKEIVTTDDSWKCNLDTPFVFSQLRVGEQYDFTKYDSSWNTSSDVTGWCKTVIDDRRLGKLRICKCQPVREDGETIGKVIKKLADDKFVIDYGQNIAGYAKLNLTIPCGQQVVLTYAENVDENGNRVDNNMQKDYPQNTFATDTVWGNGEKICWTPSFNYHGFRYVIAQGVTEQQCYDILAVRIRQQINCNYKFDCSNDLLNKLGKMSDVSIYSNLFYHFTDCPTREKNGWINDTMQSIFHFCIEFDCKKVLYKFYQDVIDSQTEKGEMPSFIPVIDWSNRGGGMQMSSLLFELPWQYYQATGDTGLLKQGYTYMVKHLEYQTTKLDDNGILGWGLPDWAGPYKDIMNPPTPNTITDSCLYYYCIDLTLKTARLLNKNEEYLLTLKERIRKAITGTFIDKNGKCNIATQTSVAMLIAFGLYDNLQPLKEQLVQLIADKDYHHHCGSLGLKYLYKALDVCKLNDIAYKIINQDTYPCYKSWIDKGETSLCETWRCKSSKNHHMFSSFMDWYIGSLVGIKIDKAGFEQISITPFFPNDMNNMSYKIKTHLGQLSIRWKREGEIIVYNITKPHKMTVTVDGKVIGDNYSTTYKL